MPSNTRNVKLGVCQVFFDGVDLGYTKGGVEVTVKTDVHKVQIDQFGKTSINELVMGREVMAKVPLAETTLENMVAIMPGASLAYTGGTAATGTITIATNPSNTETIVVNGKTIAFMTAVVDPTSQVAIGASAAATAAALNTFLNASTDPLLAYASYSVAGAVVTVTYGAPIMFGTTGMRGTEGNSYTLATGTAGVKVTVSGATLTGGAEPTAKVVSVTSGIGNDLLSLSKELRLHPFGKALTDKTDDFVMPTAMTAGALTFAYKLEDERIFNTEFTGYPDPVTGVVFKVGA